MPTPSSSISDTRPPGRSWFAAVPAYRLATLRVLLAVITLVIQLPSVSMLISAYVNSSFHVSPVFAWMPRPTPFSGVVLIILQWVAGVGLLLGVVPRLSAWFLALAGFYVIALDPEHYAHNYQFHLTLLVLAGCFGDRVPWRRLLRGDEAGATCAAWPEHLIRIQLAIVFFYAALDKVFSPHWGLSGTLLQSLPLGEHVRGLRTLQYLNRAVLTAAPTAASVATIVVEFFLAVSFLCRPLWRAAIVVAFVFMVYLEFLVRPRAFAWDVIATLVLFVSAADRGWNVFYDPGCAACAWTRVVLTHLDWLRRLGWVTREHASATASPRGDSIGLELIGPRGRVYRGFAALRVLPLVLPAPVFVALAAARFAGGFLAGRGLGPWYDVPYIALGVWLLLWVPGVARLLARPLHAASFWSHARERA